MTRNQVLIRAIRNSGEEIEWEYDSPQQCAHFWRTITTTGLAPDTGCELTAAFYFKGANEYPSKNWSKTGTMAFCAGPRNR